MCFGPSKAEKQAAQQAQQDQQEAADEASAAADEAQREEAEVRAGAKQEDISEALDARTKRRGMSGGAGRRSLFSSSAAGFLGRFQ
jgi:hypothetical protein